MFSVRPNCPAAVTGTRLWNNIGTKAVQSVICIDHYFLNGSVHLILAHILCPACSGAGTNLKVGSTCPTRIAGKKFVVPVHFFGATSTISRFGERSRDGQYSLVSFVFAVFLLTVPLCPAICKSGGHLPMHVPYGVGATACV